jgi:hypothetical protein
MNFLHQTLFSSHRDAKRTIVVGSALQASREHVADGTLTMDGSSLLIHEKQALRSTSRLFIDMR